MAKFSKSLELSRALATLAELQRHYDEIEQIESLLSLFVLTGKYDPEIEVPAAWLDKMPLQPTWDLTLEDCCAVSEAAKYPNLPDGLSKEDRCRLLEGNIARSQRLLMEVIVSKNRESCRSAEKTSSRTTGL